MSSIDERKRPFVIRGDDGTRSAVEPSKRAKKGGFRIKSLNAETGFGRTNDEIHSSISYCPVMKAVMDTKQVQRLRGLKQLGTAEYVYVNSNHNRFEHSLGVAHLAKILGEQLQKQRNLRMTDKDVLCIKLAGLCHDLGHGPFSHVYDSKFPNQLSRYLKENPELLTLYDEYPEVKKGWKHEDASVMMIDALLCDLGLQIDLDNLDKPLKQIGNGIDARSMRVFRELESSQVENPEDILTSRDWVFIKECIIGSPLLKKTRLNENESGFIGRPHRNQEYLYDVVANRHTGLDVDKIDYYARDQRRSNREAGEIELRMIAEAFVARGECSKPDKCFRCKNKAVPLDHLMICYPEKMVEHAIAFFNKRFELHSKIYTHHKSLATTLMVCDIFTLADPYFKIPTFLDDDNDEKDCASIMLSTTPRFLPISRAMLDKVAYFRLRDSVIDQIMATATPELKPARKLISRLYNHDMYKCTDTMKIDISNPMERDIWNKTEQQLQDDFLRLGGVHRDMDGNEVCLERNDVIVLKDELHHGAGDDNPLQLMRFLPKRDIARLATSSVEKLPLAKCVDPEKHKSHCKMTWKERMIRFYCRGPDDKVDLLRHIFQLWQSELQQEEDCPQTLYSEEEVGGDDEPVILTQETVTPSRHDMETEYAFDELSPIPSAPRGRRGVPNQLKFG